MRKKLAVQIRRKAQQQIDKEGKAVCRLYFNYICTAPLKRRLEMAGRILFGIKLPEVKS